MAPLDLYLFSTDVASARAAEAAGVASVIVDWEHHGKAGRQRGYDTELNAGTAADVRALADALSIPVTVRVDSLRGQCGADVERALDAGAETLMLPMAESAADVERFLTLVRGRARTLVQLETASLVDRVATIRDLPWDSAYVGLNDLMISRRADWLWTPLLDGTLDRVFDALAGRPVGFGGVTVMGGGHPIPFSLLLREMERLSCRLSFLRRTFWREIEGRDVAAELDAVRAAWRAARLRSPEAVARDHAALQALLGERTPARPEPALARA